MKKISLDLFFNENGKKKFQCCQCEKVFEKSILILHHIYKFHREKKFECDKCNKKFAFKGDMERHVQKCDRIFKSKTRKLKCEKCGKTFALKSKLELHLNNCDGTYQSKIGSDIYTVMNVDEVKKYKCSLNVTYICKDFEIGQYKFYYE